jgi:hypothetical protein
MTSPRSLRRSLARRAAATAAAVIAFAAAAPASASTAAFFPKGSGARVDRHHVTIAVTASGTITWTTLDLSGAGGDVGVLVAVKAGGRIELTARSWIDAVEDATRVVVSAIPPGDCKPINVAVNVNVDGGISVPAPSGGCNGDSTASANGSGGGGCWSASSDEGSGCGSPKPSENGHPGCSAFNTSTGCSPADNGGSSGGFDASSPLPPRVGPYDVVRVHAADGSALAWLDANGYDPGLSFAQAAAAAEADGYELYALRARAPASSSIVQSLRVVTTSPTTSFPLRMLRVGAASRQSVTPLTFVVLSTGPQKLDGTNVLKIDPAKLTSSNYDSLAAQLLGEPTLPDAGAPFDAGGDSGGEGGAPDGGASDAGVADGGAADAGSLADAGAPALGETRWLFESARPVANRRSSGGDASPDAASLSSSTLADSFASKCAAGRETHLVCRAGDGGVDGAAPDASAGEAGAPDGGASDAGVSDAGATDAGAGDAGASIPGCAEVDRLRCDDLDVALGVNGTAVATRFRAVIAGEAAGIKDLSFSVATDAVGDGRYTVRNDGTAGLCEPIAVSASAEGDTQTCRQARPPAAFTHMNAGPFVLVLSTIAAVGMIMRRARRKR